MAKITYRSDFILLGTTIGLVVSGILILSSVSAALSQEKFGTTYYYLNHQILFGLIPGLILAFLLFLIPLNLLRKWSPFFLLVNLTLLAMVFLPKIGTTYLGGTRWISIGPISLQPSEFLKLTFILYLAAWLTNRTEKMNRKEFSQTLIAFLMVIGLISLLLFFQPDAGTLGIIFLVSAIMYFSAGTPLWHIVLLFLIGSGGLLALIKLAPYRMRRWTVFLRPDTDPLGMSFQIKQALIAVGSGGILGMGLGMSRQKFGYLPHTMSDSIFAIFSEETGFVGTAILISLFLIFLWRGFKISKESKNRFSQLMALGITGWIVLQSFINIGSMIAVLPLVGIPLPFISYGGSALVAELAGVGILLNISKQKY